MIQLSSGGVTFIIKIKIDHLHFDLTKKLSQIEDVETVEVDIKNKCYNLIFRLDSRKELTESRYKRAKKDIRAILRLE